MAHVVNLMVQALLAALNEANDPETDDYYIPNKHLPFHYDPNDDDEVQEMEAEVNMQDNENEGEEFEELLNMPDLENEELDDEITAKVVNLSEVKKVRSRNTSHSTQTFTSVPYVI
jgi:cytidylate kinase